MTLEPLLQASPAIQVHAVAAIAAFAVGGLVLFRRKGGRVHMMIGRAWVALMVVVAVSSFFIHTIRLWGPWSPIHLLSITTLLSLAWGVAAIRGRHVNRHRRIMQATYVGALCIAGFFTFLPGRIMHDVLFTGTTPVQFAVLAAGLLVAAATLWSRQRRSARPAGRPARTSPL